MEEITRLSLEEKVGQMFMCGFHGLEPTVEIQTLIEKYHVGGVIYFRRNVDEPEQIAKLSQALQQVKSNALNIPHFVAIDQEGGMVSRIDKQVALAPGAMALGAARSEEAAYETARITGRELRMMGINMNFAPSVDVNNNSHNPVIGVRSYGEDPELVAKLGAAAVRGYQEERVSATIKHFPGHGDTDVDSHLGLPTVPHHMERLEQLELYPFAQLAADVDAVMSAHVIFPAYEAEHKPGTVSHKVMTELLRDKLGFEGLIVTDCLEMHAISKEYGIPQGAVMAIEAGADLILVSHTYTEQAAAVKAVIEAVRSGRIAESRIDASVERILSLKQRRQMDDFMEIGPDFAALFGLPADWETIRKVSEQSITLVKDADQLPLENQPVLVIWAEPRESTEVVEIIEQDMTLGQAMRGYFSHVEEIKIGLQPSPEDIEQILTTSGAFKQVVVATHNPVARLNSGQVELVKQLHARSGLRLIVAATRNPYDLNEFPEIPTYLCSYENRPMAMQSLAKVLAGRIKAQGKLPVSLSKAYPAE
jgi:beta-N-acetylhexosaminidase